MKSTFSIILLFVSSIIFLSCEKDGSDNTPDNELSEIATKKQGPDCEEILLFGGDGWISGYSNQPLSYADDAMTLFNNHYAPLDDDCRLHLNSQPIIMTKYFPMQTTCLSAMELNIHMQNVWLTATNDDLPTVPFDNTVAYYQKSYYPTHFEFLGLEFFDEPHPPYYAIDITYEIITCRDETSEVK